MNPRSHILQISASRHEEHRTQLVPISPFHGWAWTRDQNGEVEFAYVLILTLVIVPLCVLVQQLCIVLQRSYEVVSLFVTLPFP
jgi:hypothetical protein